MLTAQNIPTGEETSDTLPIAKVVPLDQCLSNDSITFPNSMYPTLRKLFEHVNASPNPPSILIIEQGIHTIEPVLNPIIEERIHTQMVNHINVNVPISIIGSGRDCIVNGGFKFNDDARRFYVGDNVKARWSLETGMPEKCKWSRDANDPKKESIKLMSPHFHPGKISQINQDGTYNITFDDDSKSRTVTRKTKFIPEMKSDSSEILNLVGNRVKVQWVRRCYSGSIVEYMTEGQHQGKHKCVYDDGDIKYYTIEIFVKSTGKLSMKSKQFRNYIEVTSWNEVETYMYDDTRKNVLGNEIQKVVNNRVAIKNLTVSNSLTHGLHFQGEENSKPSGNGKENSNSKPSWASKIEAAIRAMKERSGSSLPSIKRALCAEPKSWRYINNALKKGVASGAFIKNKGKYKNSKIIEHEHGCSWINNGMSFELENVFVHSNAFSGIVCEDSKGTVSNCEISHNQDNGIYASHAIVSMKGENTSVHDNCCSSRKGDYGVHAFYDDNHGATIKLYDNCSVFNNESGGGNFGGKGVVSTVGFDYVQHHEEISVGGDLKVVVEVADVHDDNVKSVEEDDNAKPVEEDDNTKPIESVAEIAEKDLPFGGDIQAAQKACDRDAIRTIFEWRNKKEVGEKCGNKN